MDLNLINNIVKELQDIIAEEKIDLNTKFSNDEMQLIL